MENLKKMQSKLQESGFNKLSFLLVLILTFLLPIFFIPFPSFNFLFGKMVLIFTITVLLLIFWLLSRLKDKSISFSKNPVWIAGIIVPLIYLISTFVSDSTVNSFFGQGFDTGTSLFALTLFILIFLVASVLKNRKKIYYLLLTVIGSFVVLSLFQILRLVIGDGLLPFGLASNSTANLIGKWNEVGIFYGLISALSLWVIDFTKNSKKIKIIGYITLIISLFFVALVNFSLVWFVLGVFAFLISALILSSGIKEGIELGRSIPKTSLVVFLLSVVFAFNIAGTGVFLSQKFSVFDTDVRPSIQGTLDIAKETLTGKNLFIGAGPNEFTNQWLVHKPVEVNNTIYWNADFNVGFSFILTSLITVGVLGFLAWLVFLGFLLYFGFGATLNALKDKTNGYLVSLTFVSTVYLWVFALLYVPSNAILGLTAIFTGAMISLLIQNNAIKFKTVSTENSKSGDFVLSVVVMLLILVSVVGIYSVGQRYIASIYGQKGLMSLDQEGGLEQAEEEIVKSIRFSTSDTYYRFLSEINLFKLQSLLSNEELSEEELKSQAKILLNNTIGSANEAVVINQNNYQNWFSLGKVYEALVPLGIEGALEQSMSAYVTAANLNPKNPLIPFVLGILEYSNKNYENAIMVLERAVILKPNYSDAKYFLGLSYYYTDRDEEAVLQFKDLILLNPENKDLEVILSNLKVGTSPFRGLVEELPVEELEEEEEQETEKVIEE